MMFLRKRRINNTVRFCVAGNWAISETSGHGIEGVILNVHDVTTRPMVVKEKKAFRTSEEAHEYCVDKGYLRVYHDDGNY